MAYAVEFSDKARFELFNAWSWYELQQPELGNKFEEEVYNKVRLILRNPLHYTSYRNFRQVKIETFPYLIVYNVNNERNLILILSIFHTSRHPGKKSKHV